MSGLDLRDLDPSWRFPDQIFAGRALGQRLSANGGSENATVSVAAR
jgi:hypothetical protein